MHVSVRALILYCMQSSLFAAINSCSNSSSLEQKELWKNDFTGNSKVWFHATRRKISSYQIISWDIVGCTFSYALTMSATNFWSDAM